MAYDINKYKKRRLYVKMPNGLSRWIHADYLDTAWYNLHTAPGKQKQCKGWIENVAGEWFYHFHNPLDDMAFRAYIPKRKSYPNRSATDIAKRRIEEAIERAEREHAY